MRLGAKRRLTTAGRMTGVGAGVLFCARDTKRMLYVLRSSTCESPNTWCCLGGGVEPGESLEEGVRREVMEEAGFSGQYDLIPMHVDVQGDFTFHNYFAWVDHEFIPQLNDEHTDYEWSSKLPTPMHPGLLRSMVAYHDSKRGKDED